MPEVSDFESFGKISRLSRECVITEKIDGTNGSILIADDGRMWIGSRARWIYGPGVPPMPDNHGFVAWVLAHKDEIITGLGIGRHYGEWWGQGIQRGYGLTEKRFSLFNTHRWADDAVRPQCCHIVPILATGIFSTDLVEMAMVGLSVHGSKAAPGFKQPEGVVIYHKAANQLFKKTLEKDEAPKGSNEVR
jgi:hypothetical protein